MLKIDLENFYIKRLEVLHKDVTDYFEKYWNVEVKEIYLRLLSSPQPEDQSKALTGFWSEAKELGEYPPNIEEAIVMFLNYFL